LSLPPTLEPPRLEGRNDDLLGTSSLGDAEIKEIITKAGAAHFVIQFRTIRRATQTSSGCVSFAMPVWSTTAFYSFSESNPVS